MKRLMILLAVLLVGTVLDAAPTHATSTFGLQVDPLPASTKAGSALYLTGTAPSGRVAVMQVLRGGRWLTISGQSGAGASFSFRVPTSYYGIRTVRAMSPQSGLAGEVDGDAMTVHVVPAYTPQGTGGQATTSDNGYRWNPCAAIRYRVNLAGMPSTNLRLIKAALRKVHMATGLTFSYAGSSRVVPFGGGWNRSVPSSGLYFAFVTASTVPAIKGIAGLGGEGALVTTASGSKVIASGGVSLEKGWWKKLYGGFRSGPSRGSLLLHEIGHAVGLMHVGAKPEIMYPVLGPWSYGRYGRGDLAGLQQLGADQGCLR